MRSIVKAGIAVIKTSVEGEMFLRTRETGDLVEVLDISALVDPCRDEMPGRCSIGGEQQIPVVFKKSALQFP